MYRRYFLLALSSLTFLTQAEEQNYNSIYATSSSTFALNLLKEFSQTSQGNIVFSPTSIDILLSQLQQGASGNTAQELVNVLGRSDTTSRLAYSSLMPTFSKDNKDGVTMNVAAKMFLRPDFLLNESFQKTSAENFQSEAELYNLSSPDSAAYINNWVSNATNNNINDVISQDALTEDTKMVLVSAMFFKGQWKDSFKKANNNKFRTTKNDSIDVPYMVTAKRLEAGEDPALGLKWVKVPYKDEKYAMMLILPTVKLQLDSVISNLTTDILMDLVNSIENRYVRLRMPIFTLKSKVNLKNTLSKVGLSSMFSDEAEFPGIASGVKVSDAVHSALLDVNEEGTKAAAATGFYVTTLSFTVYEDEMQFIANQPFLAVIIDKERKIPYFIAKVTRPN